MFVNDSFIFFLFFSFIFNFIKNSFTPLKNIFFLVYEELSELLTNLIEIILGEIFKAWAFVGLSQETQWKYDVI